MEALRLPPADQPVAQLSGGERRRVALCRLLISNPDVLLLDEPTNHLDADSVEWIEAYLKRFKGTLIVVTHDSALGARAGRQLRMEDGELRHDSRMK